MFDFDTALELLVVRFCKFQWMCLSPHVAEGNVSDLQICGRNSSSFSLSKSNATIIAVISPYFEQASGHPVILSKGAIFMLSQTTLE